MNTIEDRLRDAFAAIDRQVDVPPMPTPVPAVPSSVRWLTAAAAVLAVVGATVFLATRDIGHETVVADDGPAVDFLVGADTACRAMHADLEDVVLQFATADAYALLAPRRAAALQTMRSSIAALPDANEDTGLRERVLDMLDGAIAAFEGSGRAGGAGDVDLAGARWSSGHRLHIATLELLAARGAGECR